MRKAPRLVAAGDFDTGWQSCQTGPPTTGGVPGRPRAGPSCGWLIRMKENENPEPGAGKELVRRYVTNMTCLGRAQVTRLLRQLGNTRLVKPTTHHYAEKFAPNPRETFRRQAMHQFMAAGIALYNPGEPGRAVNSPRRFIRSSLGRSRGCAASEPPSGTESSKLQTLTARYARERECNAGVALNMRPLNRFPDPASVISSLEIMRLNSGVLHLLGRSSPLFSGRHMGKS